jgi:hypothetical protein
MNFQVLLEGKSVVKVDVDLPVLVQMLRDAIHSEKRAQSTPATQKQMEELLSRIDQRSVQFLKEIASSDHGSITWRQMRSIFGIKNPDDWSAYSGSFGKGITRAYRHILDDKTAKLVWWIDNDWKEVDWDDDMCSVFVDGQALTALRSATLK